MRDALTTAARDHPDKRIRLFFQDEARVGQKGRLCHRWWIMGQRPPGLCDQRFDWTYLFAAIDPITGDAFALVMPTVSTKVMQRFLDDFSKMLADDEHAVMVLDGAGWHAARSLRVPENMTLVHQPPYSPECNPVERVWLFLRERFLSLQVWPDKEAIIKACCDAWNALVDDPERIQSLCLQPWVRKVIS
ncbi:IS630 family transposase [Rhodospira trueperi]|nr:IS630 family transposase [Rhodospira trueperi]